MPRNNIYKFLKYANTGKEEDKKPIGLSDYISEGHATDDLALGLAHMFEGMADMTERALRPDNMTPTEWKEHQGGVLKNYLTGLRGSAANLAEGREQPELEEFSAPYFLRGALMSAPETVATMVPAALIGGPLGAGAAGVGRMIGAPLVRGMLSTAQGRALEFALQKAYQSENLGGKLARALTPNNAPMLGAMHVGAMMEANSERQQEINAQIRKALENGTYRPDETELAAERATQGIYDKDKWLITALNYPQFRAFATPTKSLLGNLGWGIGGTLAEGTEEALQEVVRATEMGEPVQGRNLASSFGTGMLLGGAMHGIGSTANYASRQISGQAERDRQIEEALNAYKEQRKDASQEEANFYRNTFRGNVQDTLNRQGEYREETARQSYREAANEARLQQRLPALRNWADKHSGGQMSDAVFDSIVRNAQEIGVPVERALAQAIAENDGKQEGVSPAGAIGVMQLMPGTAEGLGVDPYDTEQNIRGGIQYLKQQYDRFGDWNLAHAAYNAGAGNVEKAGNRVPAFYETQNYVAKINGFMNDSPQGSETRYAGEDGKGEGRYWVRQGDNVSFDGAQPDLLNAVDMLGEMFYKRTGKKLVVSAGTNGEHAAGEHSHGAGWKVDVVDAGANGVGMDEDGALFTADYRAQPFLKEFIEFGRSLGLGMNLEAEGTPNVHIDVALDGTQWDGNGDNAGGFNRNNVSQSRAEEIFNERYDPNKYPVPQWQDRNKDEQTKPLFDLNAEDAQTQSLLAEFARARASDDRDKGFFKDMFNEAGEFQDTEANRAAIRERYGEDFSEWVNSRQETPTSPARTQNRAPRQGAPKKVTNEDILAATDDFLGRLRTDRTNPNTLLELQEARRAGDVAKMESILRQNNAEITPVESTAPVAPSPQPPVQSENVVQNNQPPENILTSEQETAQPQQETKPATPKPTKEQKQTQTHINRVRQNVRDGVENRTKRQKQGESIIWLAEKNGIEIPDNEIHGLQIGAPNMVRRWRDNLLEAGVLNTQPAQQVSSQNNPPAQNAAPPVSEEQKKWNDIKRGYQERGEMMQKARTIGGLNNIQGRASAPTPETNTSTAPPQSTAETSELANPAVYKIRQEERAPQEKSNLRYSDDDSGVTPTDDPTGISAYGQAIEQRERRQVQNAKEAKQKEEQTIFEQEYFRRKQKEKLGQATEPEYEARTQNTADIVNAQRAQRVDTLLAMEGLTPDNTERRNQIEEALYSPAIGQETRKRKGETLAELLSLPQIKYHTNSGYNLNALKISLNHGNLKAIQQAQEILSNIELPEIELPVQRENPPPKTTVRTPKTQVSIEAEQRARKQKKAQSQYERQERARLEAEQDEFETELQIEDESAEDRINYAEELEDLFELEDQRQESLRQERQQAKEQRTQERQQAKEQQRQERREANESRREANAQRKRAQQEPTTLADVEPLEPASEERAERDEFEDELQFEDDLLESRMGARQNYEEDLEELFDRREQEDEAIQGLIDAESEIFAEPSQNKAKRQKQAKVVLNALNNPLLQEAAEKINRLRGLHDELEKGAFKAIKRAQEILVPHFRDTKSEGKPTSTRRRSSRPKRKDPLDNKIEDLATRPVAKTIKDRQEQGKAILALINSPKFQQAHKGFKLPKGVETALGIGSKNGIVAAQNTLGNLITEESRMKEARARAPRVRANQADERVQQVQESARQRAKEQSRRASENAQRGLMEATAQRDQNQSEPEPREETREGKQENVTRQEQPAQEDDRDVFDLPPESNELNDVEENIDAEREYNHTFTTKIGKDGKTRYYMDGKQVSRTEAVEKCADMRDKPFTIEYQERFWQGDKIVTRQNEKTVGILNLKTAHHPEGYSVYFYNGYATLATGLSTKADVQAFIDKIETAYFAGKRGVKVALGGTVSELNDVESTERTEQRPPRETPQPAPQQETPPSTNKPAPTRKTPAEQREERTKNRTPKQQQPEDESESNVIKGEYGGEAEIESVTGVEHQVKYKVVEASDLVTSHERDEGGYTVHENSNFPQELQPRDRETVSMTDALRRMIGHLIPKRFFQQALSANIGAPVVRKDGVILNGNGRTIAVIESYKEGKADNYKEALIDNAQKFGINPSKVAKMKQPILVREIVSDDLTLEQQQDIARDAEGGAKMGAREQAKADAKRISEKTLTGFNPNDIDLSASKLNGATLELLTDVFRDILTGNEINAYTDAKGNISTNGITRAKNALFAYAYGSDELLTRSSEASNDDNIRNVTAALMNAAPQVAIIRAGMQSGLLHNYNSNAIVEAVGKLSDLRKEGKAVKDFLRETQLAGMEFSNEAREILSFIDRNGRSAKRITEFFQNIAQGIQSQGDPKQGSLFGANEPIPFMDLIKTAIKKIEGGMDDLFAAPKEKSTTSKETSKPKDKTQPKADISGTPNIDTSNVVAEKDLTPAQKLLVSFGKKLGVEVVFFNNPDGRFRGVHKGGKTFLNINGNKELGGVFWHESFHWLKNNNPELYKALVKAAGITDAQRRAYLETSKRTDLQSNEEIDEEILADMMDDVAKRTGLFQSLAGKNRGLIERVIQWFKDTLNKFIDHFRNPQGKLTTAQAQALASEFGRIANQLKDPNGNKIFRYNRRTHNVELADGRDLANIKEKHPEEQGAFLFGERPRITFALFHPVSMSIQGRIQAQENSGTTQVSGTKTMYVKALQHLRRLKNDITTVLDYGAGLGLGTDAMRENNPDLQIDSHEPNPQRWQGKNPPTFTDNTKIKSQYDAILNTNVLNVVEPEIRRAIVRDIGSLLNVGGKALITTRSWRGDIEKTKNYTLGDEPHSMWIPKTVDGKIVQVYQKGFDGNELVDYVSEVLGSNFKVEKVSGFGKSGVIVTRLAGNTTSSNENYTSKFSIGSSDNSTKSFKQRVKNLLGIEGKNIPIHKRMKRQLEDLSDMKIAADHLPEGVQVKIDKIAKVIRTGREYDWANILPEVGNAVAEQLGITQSAEMGNYIGKFILNGAPNDESAEAKEFAKAMRENTEMRNKVMAIRGTFDTWNNMSAEEQMIASTRYDKEIPPLKERAQKFWQYLRTELFDTLMPIHYHVAKFVKATGIKLSESINPEIAFRNLRGMQQRAMRFVYGNEYTLEALQKMYPNVDFSGWKPIAMILESIKAEPGSQRYMLFDQFVKACHFLDIHRHNDNVLMQQGKIRGEIRNLRAELDKADTKKKKAELERSIRKKEESLEALNQKIMDTPDAYTYDKCADLVSKYSDEFGEAQKDLVRYSRVLLDIWVDSGMMDRRRYHQLLEAYPNYVPLHREFDENPNLNTADSMKQMLGSTKDVKDAIAAIANNTFDYIQRTEKNKAKLLLANLANFDGVGGIFELVDGSSPNDGTIIHFYENGKRKALQCSDEDIVKAVNSMNQPTMNLFLKVLQVPALMLRATATGLSPGFILGNFLRDPQDAFMVSKRYGAESTKALAKDFRDAFNPLVTGKYMLEAIHMGKLYEEYAVSGAAQADFFSFDRDYKAEAIERLTKKNYKRFASPKGVIELLGKLGEWSELSTRLRQYDKVKKSRAKEHGGINIYDDLVAAAFESRDFIDFARHGNAGRTWNTLTAFANPVLQGFDKQWRTYDFGKLKKFGGTEETQKEFYTSVARLFLGGVLPALVLSLLHKDDDWYKDDVQDWEKENYWILNEYMRVPKGADVGLRFFSNLTEHLISRDPVRADKVLQPLKGILPDLMPTAFLPIFECMANYDLFRRQPIVPQREVNKYKDTPELQYDSTNSKLAVLLGRVTGVSPRYIDHVIYGYTSGFGKEATHLMDTVTPGRHTAWTRSDLPFISRILRTPYRAPKIVSEYYEEFGRQESYAQRLAWEKKHGNPNAKPSKEYDPALHRRLKNIQRAMQNLNAAERAIMDDPKLTSEQVEEKREEIQKRRVELCRKAFQRAQ